MNRNHILMACLLAAYAILSCQNVVVLYVCVCGICRCIVFIPTAIGIQFNQPPTE